MKTYMQTLMTALVTTAAMVAAPVTLKADNPKPAVSSVPTASIPANADTYIKAVLQANDPSTAVAAFANGLTTDRGNPGLYAAYVRRMVQFGTPEMSYSQAVSAVTMDPGEGLSWAVIGYVTMQQGNPADAINDILLAWGKLPDDPFVLRTAGQLMAWYDMQNDKSAIPADARQALLEMKRSLLSKDEFLRSYNEAMAAYQTTVSPTAPQYASTGYGPETGYSTPYSVENNYYSAASPDYGYGYGYGYGLGGWGVWPWWGWGSAWPWWGGGFFGDFDRDDFHHHHDFDSSGARANAERSRVANNAVAAGNGTVRDRANAERSRIANNTLSARTDRSVANGLTPRVTVAPNQVRSNMAAGTSNLSTRALANNGSRTLSTLSTNRLGSGVVIGHGATSAMNMQRPAFTGATPSTTFRGFSPSVNSGFHSFSTPTSPSFHSFGTAASPSFHSYSAPVHSFAAAPSRSFASPSVSHGSFGGMSGGHAFSGGGGGRGGGGGGRGGGHR